MVSHRGFRRFFSYIGQGNITTKDIPDRHTVAAKAQALSADAKERIKQEIKVYIFMSLLNGYIDHYLTSRVRKGRFPAHLIFGLTKLNVHLCA